LDFISSLVADGGNYARHHMHHLSDSDGLETLHRHGWTTDVSGGSRTPRGCDELIMPLSVPYWDRRPRNADLYKGDDAIRSVPRANSGLRLTAIAASGEASHAK
jgi:hypothetical protein